MCRAQFAALYMYLNFLKILTIICLHYLIESVTLH